MLFFLCKFVFCILACLHESYVFVFANLVWLCESCMTVCVWTWIAWSSDPFGVNFSFLSRLFMFGHKLLDWVVLLVVNCSLRVVPQHQVESLKLEGRVLKTRKHPRFSFMSLMIACMYVCHEGRVLKTQKHLKFVLLCGFSHFLLELHQSPFLNTPPLNTREFWGRHLVFTMV